MGAAGALAAIAAGEGELVGDEEAHDGRGQARFGRRIWFVLNYEQLEDWDRPDREAFEELLREQCRLEARFPLVVESRDLSVYVFLKE